jgi:hypothetical protein
LGYSSWISHSNWSWWCSYWPCRYVIHSHMQIKKTDHMITKMVSHWLLTREIVLSKCL